MQTHRLANFRRPRAFALGLATLVATAGGCTGSTEPRDRLLLLEVAPARVACVGIAPMECLQVREIGGGAERPFAPTFIPIVGFNYEPGYRYVIRVVQRTVPNPPADGSSIVYRLITVVARTPAA